MANANPQVPRPVVRNYMVTCKRKADSRRIRAYGHTQDDQNHYFHQNPDLTDQDTLFAKAIVKTIRNEGPVGDGGLRPPEWVA